MVGPAYVGGDGLEGLVGRCQLGILGGPQHSQCRLIMRGEFFLPVGQLSPVRSLEELAFGGGEGVRIDQGTSSHPHPAQAGEVPEEGHPEDASEAQGGCPEPTLEVPVRFWEILGLEPPPLLQDQDRVSLLG